MIDIDDKSAKTGLEIAVIGMAGRFPGADDIHGFWNNLKNGIESITFYSEKELEKQGVSSNLAGDPFFVNSNGGILDNKEYFDTAFFGYTPLEAEIMDPQVRLVHECAWTSLENAGYNPESFGGLIGLYTGASPNFNWEVFSYMSDNSETLGKFLASQLIDKEFISTQVSYKLNLKGPSLSLYTACSTSLVAIHLACQGLLSGECDMALAGGAAIFTNPRRGYVYNEGMILSPDGHCRAFDAGAGGTVSGEGAAMVVLKSLEDAVRDGDHIYAVIKGSAVNNDGGRKVGFSAPSPEGQAEVIRAALHIAEVGPESVGYIEAHGTGTRLGDPIEINALKLAFDTDEKQYCAVGSVKSNVGHLDTAAGVTGFIKAVLVLTHRLIPPTLHFKMPSPEIDFENSPFYVNAELKEWKRGGYPLRAGVSSFGIGGTNAHVVLEEWTDREQKTEKSGHQLILLSAKTETALETKTGDMLNYFKENLTHGSALRDVAYTLQVGRKAFTHRRMLVCPGVEEAVAALSDMDPGKIRTSVAEASNPLMAFMFPGQGAQYVNMGRDLYETEPVFREEMDRCFDLLAPLMGDDIKAVVYPTVSGEGNRSEINRTEYAQSVIFAVEYALARLLLSWDITPYAMIGHSIGEYTAACLSGVFSLADAVKLVVLRGRLMQRMPGGAMLGVSLPEEDLQPLLTGDLALAAVNAPGMCVVSGTHEAVDALELHLNREGHRCRRLHTSHAFHSAMMDPILKKFEQAVKEITLNEPEIPYISNVTGTWISNDEVTVPAYWVNHLRRTVRFADGVKQMIDTDIPVFVEVGPGKVLSTFVRQAAANAAGNRLAVNLMRHPNEGAADDAYLIDRIGQLWLYGVSIDWSRFYKGERRYRLPLPTYPFEGHAYRVDGDPYKIAEQRFAGMSGLQKKSNIDDWFYIPVWKQSFAADTGRPVPGNASLHHWLIFMDEKGLGVQLANRLERKGAGVTMVRAGSSFTKKGRGEYTVNPGNGPDYETLLDDVLAGIEKERALKVIHLWGVTGSGSICQEFLQSFEPGRIDDALNKGMFSLIFLAQAFGRRDIGNEIQIEFVTDNMQKVLGEEHLCPEKAAVLGVVKVMAREYPHLGCRSLDVVLPVSSDGDYGALLDYLFAEWMGKSTDREVAFRCDMRWVQTFEALSLEEAVDRPPRLRERGIYLITGGLGGIGLELARHLAASVKARLVLTGRSPFPGGNEGDDKKDRQMEKIREIEALGAEVLVLKADVTDPVQMRDAVTRSEAHFGRINGVIHSAGLADYAGVMQRRSRESTEEILAAKIKGTLVLHHVLKDAELDFFVLCSSVASIFAPFGEVGYTAANAFLDAFTHYRNFRSSPGSTAVTISIDWPAWKEVGMAAAAVKQKAGKREINLDEGILPAEGVGAFDRIMGSNLSRVAVFTRDLGGMLERLNRQVREHGEHGDPGPVQPVVEKVSPGTFQQRPVLTTSYVAPRNEREQTLANIWRDYLGFERIGVYDDFFDLGGDSLKAVGLLAKIRNELGMTVTMAKFFNQPTIDGLAEFENEDSIDGNIGENGRVTIEKAEKKEFYALSPAQKRLFILQQMDTESTVYNLWEALILEGAFDKGKMESGFKGLIKRHESLRTAFEVREEIPVQRIYGHVEFEIEYGEAGSVTETGIIKDFIRPFDLSRPPLLRVGIVKIADKKHFLLTDMHHIISDGVSMGILVKEFTALYRGEILPELGIQYKDFSQWQNDRLRSGEIKKQETYWLKEFEGQIPVIKLPTDFSRPKTKTFEGSYVSFHLGKEETGKLRDFAKAEDATLFILLFTVYNVLLYKLSGQQDIIVGTVSAGRGHPDLDRVIGMFVNTLTLRNYPAPGKNFTEFFKEVKERTLQSFDNQDYQYDDLVEKLLPGRDVGRNPLFDVMFTFTSQQMLGVSGESSVLGESDLKVEKYRYESNESKFDLIFGAFDYGESLECVFQYSTSLFKKTTVERFINYIKDILRSVLEDKFIPLQDIEISCDLKALTSDIYKNVESDFAF